MQVVGVRELLEAGDHVALQRLLLEEPQLAMEEVPGTGRRPLELACSLPALEPGSPRAGDVVTCLEVLLAAGADPRELSVRGPAARNPDAARLLAQAGAHVERLP
jgi:hypothetical protein